MNVKVNLVSVGEINGVKSALKKSTLVASKDFKEGDTIYKVSVAQYSTSGAIINPFD
jgi:hypothetical protein